MEAYGEGLHVEAEACEAGSRRAPLLRYLGAASDGSSAAKKGAVAAAECVAADATECVAEDATQDETERSVESGPRVVGLWRYRRGWLFGASVDWPPWRQADYWQIRRHLAFRDELHAAADHFIESAFGGRSFLAVHWRRGDRTHPEMGAAGLLHHDATAPGRVAAAARRLLDAFPHVRRVVLLTNSGSADELETLRRRLPFVQVGATDLAAAGLGGDPHGTRADWRFAQHHSIIEQIIASRRERSVRAKSERV